MTNETNQSSPVLTGIEFKEKHGYSITTSKLMKKYNCNTLQEYRVIRKKNKRERAKSIIPKAPATKANVKPVNNHKRK